MGYEQNNSQARQSASSENSHEQSFLADLIDLPIDYTKQRWNILTPLAGHHTSLEENTSGHSESTKIFVIDKKFRI